MVDARSKARVARLLSNDFRQDDLMGLFLFARDHCDGRETINDIGDFVAHYAERDRGIIARSVQEWFTVARFHLGQFRPHQPKLDFDLAKMPRSTYAYFRIAATRIDQKTFKAEANVTRAAAHTMLIEIASRMKQNSDGTWRLDSLSKSEEKIIKTVTSYLVVRPAFDDERLVEDFFATLKSNELITKDEMREHRKDLATVVKIYAVSVMHNSIVQVDGDTRTQLKAHIVDNSIGVAATVPNIMPATNVGAMADIFVANVSVANDCHPDLLIHPKWDFELEVGPDRRLAPLR